MMFCLSPEASAEEFCALGSHSAGSELNCYIATVSSGAQVTAQGLPQGLYIAETPGNGGKRLDLKGVAMSAGPLEFSVSVSETPELISCSLDITAAIPAIATGGDKSCAVNGSVTLEVSASAADSGSLSYQWYAAESPTPAAAIVGANSPSYSPDSFTPGRFAYCCEVTNTNNGYTSSAVSPAMHLTVSEPVLRAIEVSTLPQKRSYAPGDSLDASGLSLKLIYDDGSSKIIEGGFEASPAVFTEPGTQLVELRYEGLSCYYEVEVSLKAAEIEGIGVLTLPDKTEYKLGESLDPTGLSLRAYTAGGHFDVSEGFSCSPTVFRDSGRQSVTVEYAGKRCSFTVTVKDDNTLRSIGIASLPTRREYSAGDTLDTSGLSIQLIYGGRTEIVSTGFSCSPSLLSSPGAQEITVSYMGHTASFTITVKDAPASPTPSPSASVKPSQSPAVESSSPSATVSPIVNRDHESRELSSLVKVIFVLAILSLAALGGYVLYMQKRGKR